MWLDLTAEQLLTALAGITANNELWEHVNRNTVGLLTPWSLEEIIIVHIFRLCFDQSAAVE